MKRAGKGFEPRESERSEDSPSGSNPGEHARRERNECLGSDSGETASVVTRYREDSLPESIDGTLSRGGYASLFRVWRSRRVLPLGRVTNHMARADPGRTNDPDREIRLLKNPDGQWTARDLRVEVTAQGESREEALENLDAVVAAIESDGGHSPTDDEIRDLGVDPDVARSHDDDLPDILQ